METEKKEYVKDYELAMIYDKVCRGRNLFNTMGGHSASFWEYAVSRMRDLDSHREEPYYVYNIVTEIKDNLQPKLPKQGVNTSLCPSFRATTLYVLLCYRFRNDVFFTTYIIPEIRSTTIKVCSQGNGISFDETEKRVKALPDCCADLKAKPDSIKEENERLRAENKDLKERLAAAVFSDSDGNVNADEDVPDRKLAFSQEVQCKLFSLFLSHLNVNFTTHKRAISRFAMRLFGYGSENKCASYLNSKLRLSYNKSEECKFINDFFKEIEHGDMQLELERP
ncbi:MAG: hypothetical protein ACI3YT_04810 [Prevotella sp.]